MNPPPAGFTNEIPKIRIHFGRTPGDIEGSYFGFFQHAQALIDGFAAHDFFSVRPGIHMAMLAHLVAHIAHVYLKDINSRGRKRMVPQGRYFSFK
jgi:hypothetical protein